MAIFAVLALLSAGGATATASAATSSAGRFMTAFKRIDTQFVVISGAIFTELNHVRAQSDAQIAGAFQELAHRWGEQVGKLAQLSAPDSVSSAFGELQAAATHAGTDLGTIVTAARAHHDSAGARASEAMIRALSKARTASLAIDAKLGIR
jgi:hypothetical protein